MRTSRHNQTGAVLLIALFGIALQLLVAEIMLSRSSVEMAAAKTAVVTSQTFHLAEAAVDDARVQLIGETATVGELLQQHGSSATPYLDVLTPAGRYLAYFAPVAEGDTDRIVLVGRGVRGGLTDEVRATLGMAAWIPQPLFTYSMASSVLDMRGSAVIGSETERVPIYVDYGGAGSLDTTSGNTVWASQVDFHGTTSVAYQCPDCDNTNVFPTTPPPAPVFTTGVPQLPRIQLDLAPYYERAIAQCVADGYAQADCESGAAGSLHHITSDTTIDGAQYPSGLDGIIYIESGASVTFANNVVIRGTIIHEGSWKRLYPSGGSWADEYGIGKLVLASQANLAIDSTAQTLTFYDVDGDTQQDPPFAPGVAIGGGGHLDFRNTGTFGDGVSPGIVGFVMGGTDSSATNPKSKISSDGLIEGGLIGVGGLAYWCDPSGALACRFQGADYPDGSSISGFPQGLMGPQDNKAETTTSISNGIAGLEVGGNAHIEFRPLSGPVPGLASSGGSSNKPPLVLWSN